MKDINDALFSDVFLCDEEINFHDYYYVSAQPVDEEQLYYCVNRTGIESKIPRLFFVKRSHTMKCCEIFCIFSGKGKLSFRGKKYCLEKGQIIVLPADEPHAYSSDEKEPLGISWVEFYGGDSKRIIKHIVDVQGVILEGKIFAEVCAALGTLQQKLMNDEKQEVSLELYRMLLILMKNKNRIFMGELSQDIEANFQRAEAYIDAHLKEKITNRQMADICGLSVSYFIKQFKRVYRMSPQEYIMQRRIRKSRDLLMQTELSMDEIREKLGFCNSSHFIRRFKEKEGITPLQYRERYQIKKEEMDNDIERKSAGGF